MSLDFTLARYRELCKAILSSGYTPMTVLQYLESSGPPGRFAIIRHDVDRAVGNARRMAQLESDLGISATYYFRYRKGTFRPDTMIDMARMGHEIGYHYEAVDKARGDCRRAVEIFEREISAFREFVQVKTISMHGNPLTRWDNRDLWREHDFRSYGVLGEAYLSFNDVLYLSDTGRTWGHGYKVKDWLPGSEGGEQRMPGGSELQTTCDLIRLVETGQSHHLYLNTHPERWAYSTPSWLVSLVKDKAVNAVKWALSLKSSLKSR
jgi:hypothetical protein